MAKDQFNFIPEWISKAKVISEEFREAYPELFQETLQALFTVDPLGLAFDDNTDEYNPEVGSILPRLTEAQTEVELQRIIHEEFVRWADEDTAGPIDNYHEPARLIWKIRSKYAVELGLSRND